MHSKPPNKKNLYGNSKEEDDFYMENGFVVFTEKHHRKRGYCCKSGCRHCPYGYKIDLSLGK